MRAAAPAGAADRRWADADDVDPTVRVTRRSRQWAAERRR